VLIASIQYALDYYRVVPVTHHEWNAAFVAIAILQPVTGVLSFLGAYLLLKGGRPEVR
jgi:hypothetical protein